ncbi:hypothetical protein Bca4012_031073 [Brassica carinata]
MLLKRKRRKPKLIRYFAIENASLTLHQNHLGIADYHHAANFVDVSIYIIIFSGARFSPSGNTDFYAAGYTLFTLATNLHAQIYY